MSCPPLPPEACTSWLRQASARRAGPREPAPDRAGHAAGSAGQPARPPAPVAARGRRAAG